MFRRLKLSNGLFALLLTLAYFLAAFIVTSHHEIWRDEAQTFLMAKDSRNVPDLLLRIKNDLHPPLWHIVLFLLTRLTSSILAMQVIHLAFTAAAVYLFARYSHFSRLNKVLFALSYYALFEYGVIARNYSIGLFFLFLFCVLYTRREIRYVPLGAALAFLSLTSLHALILAMALTLALAVDRLLSGRAETPRLFWTGMGLGLAGIATAVISALPNAESIYAKRMALDFSSQFLSPVLRLIPRAFFPLPEPTFHFWNTTLFTHLPGAALALYLLIIVILAFSFFLFLPHRPSAIYFILATGALLAFFFFSYFGYARHHGFFFLVFLSAMWMSQGRIKEPLRPPLLRALSGFCQKNSPVVLSFFLGVQVLAGMYAAASDIRHPFSQGHAAAKFILRHHLQDRVLVGDIDYTMSTVSAYLNRPIYLPRGERWGTFQLYIHPPRNITTMHNIIAAAERLTRKTGKDFLLILNYPLDNMSLMSRSLRLVGKTGRAIVEDESFYLYRRYGARSPHPQNRAPAE